MSRKVKILLAEDDPNLGSILRTFLTSKGFEVSLAQNGKTAFEKFNREQFDFCVFDVMMPEMDGFTLAEQIRKLDKKVPILFLTAKSMKDDVLQGFTMGADDYVTKPFEMSELLARINAILRRSDVNTEEEKQDFEIGAFQYDPETRLLRVDGDEKKLTTKENQLLHLLVKNRNDILDRRIALEAIWGEDNYFNGRSMDVYIAKLRKHLKEDERIEILNIHGQGFKLLVHE
ncbi:MAG: response regulator transcription factor [Crocinitomicaceae bacterium]